MHAVTRIGAAVFATFVVSLGMAPRIATGDDCTWNGGSGSWHTGGNWSCGHEPGASDNATMSTGTVTVTTNVTVNGLTHTYGTIDGPGNITVTVAMAWSGGTQDGAGTTTVGSGATLNLSGSTKTLNRDMTNNGTATWSAGTVSQPFGVTFTNGASGILNATGSNPWGTSGAGSVFDNLGTFNKSAGNSTTMNSSFNNDGTTSVTAGTFRMRGGGSSAGEFTGSGGTVQFGLGPYTLEVASSVTADDVLFDENSTKNISGGYSADTTTISGGTVNFNGSNPTLPNLDLTGGTLSGSSNLTISQSMTWSAGTQDGAGTTTVGPGATLNLSSSTKTLNRDMTNNGTTIWSAGTVSQPFGVTFTNGASGILNATGSNTWGTSGAGSVFHNQGAFNKVAGTTTTMYSNFSNDGTTSVTAGTFRMRGGGSSTGEFTGSGGTVQFGLGSYTLEAASSVTAGDAVFDENSTKNINGSYSANTTTISAGTVNFNGSNPTLPNLNLTGGTLSGSSNLTISQSMTWSAGTQDGAGTTTVGPGATLNLSSSTKTLNRDMTNNGTTIWSAGTVSQPFGVTFTNGASGILNATGSNTWGTIGAGSVFDNLGTFYKTAGTTTTMYSNFSNDGTTSVTVGTFRMRGGGSSTGEFIGSGGIVRFGLGTYTLEAASSVTAGDVVFDENSTKNINGSYSANTTTISAGTVNFNGSNPTLPNLNLTGGTLSGSSNLTISQSMTWSAGTQDGAGTTTVGPGATLNLSSSTKTLNRDMTNNGTATWSAGNVTQPFGVTFTNGASASLTATGSNAWGTSIAGSVFHNQGAFNKVAGTTTTMYSVFDNDGTTSVTSGTFTMRGGGSSAGEFTGSGGIVRFNTGGYTLESSSSVTSGDVIFEGSTTKNINGSYSAGNTTISGGVVNLIPSGGEAGSITLTGGTLNPAPRLEIHGDFSRTFGTYTHTGNTLAFVGGTTQNLTLSSNTTFNNLEVGRGTLLVETEVNDRVILEGLLTNYGTIRKSKPIFGGAVIFGLTAVEMNVTTIGSLTGVQVDRIDCQHPDAFGEALTDRHWKMTPSGSGYQLDLTVPHGVSPDSNVYLCRLLAPSSPWDCARFSWTADTVTRQGLTTLSDWAPGDSRLVGRLFADGFEYRCSPWIWEPPIGALGPRMSESFAACGGWFQLDTADAGADEAPRGWITGAVFDRASGNPVAGVDVLFASGGVLAGRASTNVVGDYISPPLIEGTYSVMTHGTGNYLHQQWSGVQCWAGADPTLGYPVAVNGRMIKAGVDFSLERGARVSGGVSDAVTGEAVLGATVRILSEQGTLVTEAVSDGEGRYRTLPLPVGVYTAVGVTRGGGPTVTSAPIVVSTGCGIVRVDLALR